MLISFREPELDRGAYPSPIQAPALPAASADADLIEAAARAICRERAAPACSCKASGVACRAPLSNLLHDTNPTAYQARAVVDALTPLLLERAAQAVADLPPSSGRGRTCIATVCRAIAAIKGVGKQAAG